jgi:hypothetical protein
MRLRLHDGADEPKVVKPPHQAVVPVRNTGLNHANPK